MNKMLFLNIFFAAIISCGSLTTNNVDSVTSQDKKLVGTWSGAIKEGTVILKSWEVTRKSDGTFSKTVAPGITEKRKPITVNGKWWTKNGKYFQQTEGNNFTETYNYKITGKMVSFNNADTKSSGVKRYIETAL